MEDILTLQSLKAAVAGLEGSTNGRQTLNSLNTETYAVPAQRRQGRGGHILIRLLQKLEESDWIQLPPEHPIFHDDEKARAFLEEVRWPQGPACPACGKRRVSQLHGRTTRPGLMKCLDCRAQFTVTVGTELHKSHVGLAKWCYAAWLLAQSKGQLPILGLARELDVSYTTARRMAAAIRSNYASPGDDVPR